MAWVPPPNGKRGRQRGFSDAAIQAWLSLKVLFGMPLRQTTGVVESLLRMVGLDWAAPDFSTLSRRQKTLNVHLPYRGGTGPLNLFIDSTGIKSEGEGTLSADCCAIACRIRNGTPPQPEPLHGTTQLTPRAISVDPFGNGGADITAGAASRPSLPGSYCAQPCRPVDALCEATGPILDGPVLGPSGCRNPSPHRRAQPLHRSWRTRHRARRITPSGERGSLHFNRFVQQSRRECAHSCNTRRR